MKFAHLHSHTDSSILDGVATVRKYLEAAKQKGILAIAFTDHGNLGGHLEAQLEATKIENAPKVIFGSELYVVDNLAEKTKEQKRRHLILLAKNDDGYRNLIAINNFSWRNFYFKPRIDFEVLKEYRHGLIAMSACAKGVVGSYILESDLDAAIKSAKKYKDLFGEDFYLELQLINIEAEEVNRQEMVNQAILIISKKLNIPFVITNDCHYIEEEDNILQQKVLHLSTDVGFVFSTNDLWLRDFGDLEKARKKYFNKLITPQILNRGLLNTVKIADKCDAKIEVGKQHIPKFDYKSHPMYKGESSKEELLRNLCRKALKIFLKINPTAATKFAQYEERVNRELDAIHKMSAEDYFFIVEDLIRHIREQDKIVLIRGSANGSLVCFLLEFGYIDPIEHNILFERFISPARSESGLFDVDIDIDMESEERPHAVDYLKKKYGDDKICNVGSYGRLQWRAAIKDMARVEALETKRKLETDTSLTLGEKREIEEHLEQFSYQRMNQITKLLEHGSKQEGGEVSIEESIQKYPELENWWKINGEWIKKYVEPVIGIRKSPSVHPASVVILPSHIDKWLPVRSQVNPKNKKERILCTQWEGSHTGREDLRARGVMLLDILGVKTLSIIAATFRDIEANHGIKYTMANIPFDDKKTIKWFKRGETLGVFQLSAPTITQIVRDIKPDCFSDVANLTAIDRPGALANRAHVRYAKRKHGEEKVEVLHPSIEPIMRDTYGIPIYSEHIMLISSAFAGFTPIEAEHLRQLMKQKDRKVFAQYEEKFMNGAIKKHGKKVEDDAKKIWETILRFGAYSFPKAHATSYGLISWTTMFLKVNYPTEFFKNLLNYSDYSEYPEIRTVAKRFHNVEFVMPEINKSKAVFTIHKGKLVWSLSGIKGIGINALTDIEAKQPFISFDDFYKRINRRQINKSRLASLIIAGCFRKFGDTLSLLKKTHELRSKDKKKEEFNAEYETYSQADWFKAKTECLGFQTVSFQRMYRSQIKDRTFTPLGDFNNASSFDDVVIFGQIAKVRVFDSKVDRIMSGVVYDIDGSVNFVVWHDKYEKIKGKVTLHDGDMVILRGKKRKNRDEWGLSIGIDGMVKKI